MVTLEYHFRHLKSVNDTRGYPLLAQWLEQPAKVQVVVGSNRDAGRSLAGNYLRRRGQFDMIANHVSRKSGGTPVTMKGGTRVTMKGNGLRLWGGVEKNGDTRIPFQGL
jgi:hypothetical protein